VLDRLTADTFAPAVGDTFALDAGDAGRLDFELIESRLRDPDRPAEDDSGTRAPFSLLFRGPVDPLLPQRIYRLEHESIGPLEIFIVPVARDESGSTYEAVFA
jgi:hypothetical protein